MVLVMERRPLTLQIKQVYVREWELDPSLMEGNVWLNCYMLAIVATEVVEGVLVILEVVEGEVVEEGINLPQQLNN
jgi:hypothetical protein